MPIDPRRQALTPEQRTADRLADLERFKGSVERGVPWTGSAKTFTDADRAGVGTTMVQGNEFDVIVPANAFLGVYMRSKVTNPNGSGGGDAVAGITINGVLWQLLILPGGSGGTSWVFSAPGIQGGSRFNGGIVIVDDSDAPSPQFSISDQPQELTLGFGYFKTGGSNMSFEQTRVTLFFL